MPRYARIVLPDHPHHLVQRGHNREVVFPTTRDFQVYLENLAEWKTKLKVEVYAYCLMTNHVHLVVNPGPEPRRLAKLMKELAGRHTRRLNTRDGRTGTAWDGRYKSSAIETEEYLLASTRYVELNPKRAGICLRLEDYPWSSYRAKVGLDRCDWLDLHGLYLDLGPTPHDRQVAYRAWVSAAVSQDECDFLHRAIQMSQLTGSTRFVEAVEERLMRRVAPRRPGRPRKKDPCATLSGKLDLSPISAAPEVLIRPPPPPRCRTLGSAARP